MKYDSGRDRGVDESGRPAHWRELETAAAQFLTECDYSVDIQLNSQLACGEVDIDVWAYEDSNPPRPSSRDPVSPPGFCWSHIALDVAGAGSMLSSTMRHPLHRQVWSSQASCAQIHPSVTSTDPQKIAGHATAINWFWLSNSARPQSACSRTNRRPISWCPRDIGRQRDRVESRGRRRCRCSQCRQFMGRPLRASSPGIPPRYP